MIESKKCELKQLIFFVTSIFKSLFKKLIVNMCVCVCSNSYTFLVGSQTKDAVLRSNLALFSQINICIPYDLAIVPGCIFFQNSHICLVGTMYKDCHGTVACCGRKLIAIWKSITGALEGKGG